MIGCDDESAVEHDRSGIRPRKETSELPVEIMYALEVALFRGSVGIRQCELGLYGFEGRVCVDGDSEDASRCIRVAQFFPGPLEDHAVVRMEEEFGFTESPVTVGACSDALVPDSLVGVDDDAIRIKMRVVGIGVISVAHTGYSVAEG